MVTASVKPLETHQKRLTAAGAPSTEPIKHMTLKCLLQRCNIYNEDICNAAHISESSVFVINLGPVLNPSFPFLTPISFLELPEPGLATVV